jgi:ring-1,2-phenylacetyl-CoA epoxidase subunit PaaC
MENLHHNHHPAPAPLPIQSVLDQAAYTPNQALAFEYTLRLADSALILSHRLSEWTGHGPILEEDIALANIALDLLGQARLLYPLASLNEGVGRTEDDFAYWRNEQAFLNFTLCELPNSGVASAGAHSPDYAFTIVRNYLYSEFALLRWQALCTSQYESLAGIAAKAVKETRYHVRHAQDWMLRFGLGTNESKQKVQQALDLTLPYCNEFFVMDPIAIQAAHAGLGAAPDSLEQPWMDRVAQTIADAQLNMPARSGFVSTGYKGAHSEHMGFLLAEMQSLARQHPGAQW